MNIVLHQWELSPFCGKVRRILEAKGLPYQVINYNGLLARKAAGLSPAGKLPVLDIDGQRICDSRLIAQELERRFPMPALMPESAEERAQVQVFQDWADESLYWYEIHFRVQYKPAFRKVVAGLTQGRPAYERPLMALILRRTLVGALKAQGLGRVPVRLVEERFWLLMNNLDALLAHRTWLVGGARSLADIAVGSQLHEVMRTTDISAKLATLPHLQRWLRQA
ncbi:MAG: glutathione S-transferase family protein [Rubrivivax sp.]|nr:MAG: glutathione S-transferase family protein [Rubrivivax sp.]